MLSLLQHDVDECVAAGQTLARIEAEVVDVAPIAEDRRAALWLYAWLRTHDAPRAAAPLRLDFAA